MLVQSCMTVLHVYSIIYGMIYALFLVLRPQTNTRTLDLRGLGTSPDEACGGPRSAVCSGCICRYVTHMVEQVLL